jgi:hypothetical protein
MRQDLRDDQRVLGDSRESGQKRQISAAGGNRPVGPTFGSRIAAMEAAS